MIFLLLASIRRSLSSSNSHSCMSQSAAGGVVAARTRLGPQQGTHKIHENNHICLWKHVTPQMTGHKPAGNQNKGHRAWVMDRKSDEVVTRTRTGPDSMFQLNQSDQCPPPPCFIPIQISYGKIHHRKDRASDPMLKIRNYESTHLGRKMFECFHIRDRTSAILDNSQLVPKQRPQRSSRENQALRGYVPAGRAMTEADGVSHSDLIVQQDGGAPVSRRREASVCCR